MPDLSDRAKPSAYEVRSFTIDDLEMRDGADGAISFEGVASVVGVPYGVRDQFGEYEETIAKGAFHRTIRQKDDIRLLKNHDPAHVFARTKSGTMKLTDDPHLRVLAPSLDPSNPAVQVLRSELKRGDIDQMSVGMRVRDQEWSDGMDERMIKEASLQEVSIVAFPASPTTSATVRSIDQFLTELLSEDLDPTETQRAINALTQSLKSPQADSALMRMHMARR